MNSSNIIDPRTRPAAPAAQIYYQVQSKEFLTAALASNLEAITGVTTRGIDTSKYEFPGDKTYSKYLSTRLGG